MADHLDIYVRIAADAARYAQGMQGATRETKRFADHARSELANVKRELASLGLQIGGVALAMKGLSAAGGMQSAMLDVEGNIKKVTSTAGELEKQLKAVRDTAIDVSKSMPFSAKEVVDIQNSLLKAGVAPDVLVEKNGKHGAAYAAAGLASLTGVEPGQVGDVLARIGSQFRFKDTDYAPAADTLMRGEAASPGNLQEIMYSLRQFGSNAKSMGVDIKSATAAAAALTPLGGEAGTAMNRFLEDSIGKTKQQQKALKALGLGHVEHGKFKSDFFENGKYIGLERATKLVREHLNAIKDDALKIKLATKAWGEEGARAALIFANADDDHSYAGMLKQMEEAVGIEERMRIKMSGFQMSAKAAAGTIESTLATAFDPFLGKLTQAANGINDLAGDTGKWLQDNPDARSNIAWGGVGVAGLAIAGPLLYRLLKSGKGAKGMAGAIGADAIELGKGVAVGKTLQAAAGVTPVYVVNMPSTGPVPSMVPGSSGGDGSSVIGNVAGGVVGGAATRASLKAGMAMAAGLPLSEFVALGASAIATAGVGIAAAGAAGYGVGTMAYNSLEGTMAGDGLVDKVGGSIAKVLAYFGNENAQQAVAITEKLKNTDLGGTMKIVVETAPGTNANVDAKPASPRLRYQVGNTMQGHN